MFAGPKELRRLAALDANGKSLAELVFYNYGWVRMLRPDIWLLRPLQWLYGVTHNYGVAIIIITVIIKLLFYPLTWKSFKSMQAMQHLQPQMKRLQDMYKNDRQKLNEEMMKLYREQKVNPLGGCLPMVVQIPVFISLYQVLYASIELRHAGFIWWIKDLSAPDYPMALAHGRLHGRSAMDDAHHRRPTASQNDAVHADHFHLYVPEFSGGTGDLLAGE